MENCFSYNDYEFIARLLDGVAEKIQSLPVCDMIAVAEFTGSIMPEDMTDIEAKEGIEIMLNDCIAIRKKIKTISGV